MSYKPILFNTEMVKAILEGRKTQTRRLVKQPPIVGDILHDEKGWYYEDGTRNGHSLIPPCHPGDILWVRETFLRCFMTKFLYKADDSEGAVEREFIQKGWEWKPSIHMPKEAARIFLRVKDVWVEQLREITQQQAIAEGFPSRLCTALGFEYKDSEGAEHTQRGIELCVVDFAQLWDSTIKPADRDHYGWDANPWVWVIEFERIEKPEGWCG